MQASPHNTIGIPVMNMYGMLNKVQQQKLFQLFLGDPLFNLQTEYASLDFVKGKSFPGSNRCTGSKRLPFAAYFGLKFELAGSPVGPVIDDRPGNLCLLTQINFDPSAS